MTATAVRLRPRGARLRPGLGTIRRIAAAEPAVLLAAAAAAVALVALAGWALDVRVLRSVRPGYVSLKANSCVALIALALAVIARRRLRTMLPLLLLPVAVAVTSLVEYATGAGLGVDQLLFADHDRIVTLAPGRPSIHAAAALLALSAAMLLVRRPGRRNAVAGQVVALGGFAIGFLGVAGYLSGIEALYASGLARLSLPGAAALLLLALAVLALRPHEGVVGLVTERSLAGSLGRRLLPLALAASPLMLRARLELAHEGLAGGLVADWLTTFAETAILAAAVFAAVNAVGRQERRAQRAEVAARAGEQLFRLFVDHVPGHVLSFVDLEGNDFLVSGAVEELYGYGPEELTGPNAARLRLLGEDGTRELREAERLGHFGHETQRIRKDGTVIWVRLDVVPLHDDTGKRIGFVRVTRDVTRDRELRLALADRTVELERSNRELEEFAYIASHDLSAPLRAISGYLDLIERRHGEALPWEAVGFIERATRASVRMQAMIDDLLVYSRAGRKTLALEPIDSAELLAETLELLAPAIEASGAALSIGELPCVSGDRSQVGQVLQNLVGNALKFHGDAPPRVSVGAVREGDRWRFEVQDAGIGVPAEQRDQLFKMFRRLNGELFPGAGIGLSLCKRIVERHEGSISHRPAPRGGSIFSFTLPAEEEPCHPSTDS